MASRGGWNALLLPFRLHVRSGRQGDSGSIRTFASLEDELVTHFTSRWQREIVRRLLEQDGATGHRAVGWLFRRAQRAAEKMAYRQRKLVPEKDAQLTEALTAGPGEGGEYCGFAKLSRNPWALLVRNLQTN